MTYKQWLETKHRWERLGPDYGVYADYRGYTYCAGFVVVMKDGGYVVHIDGSDAEFETLDAAEKYLWHNWAPAN